MIHNLQDLQNFPNRKQDKWYTCGPTSIRVILDYLKYPDSITTEYIEKVSGTNTEFGCTHENMKKGLDCLGVLHERVVNNTKEVSMNTLINALNKNQKIILRTLTKGVKHWIVVYHYNIDNNTFLCSDSWLGKITYTPQEIVNIWEPRDFDAFIITDTTTRPIVEKINPEKDKETITDIVAKEFVNVMSEGASHSYLNGTVDWNLSVKLTLNNQIIGCYLLAERNMFTSKNNLSGKKGIEGVALSLKPEHRNKGYGKMLISYTENLPYDYIWGKSIVGNKKHWSKRREIIGDGTFFTSFKLL